MKPSVVKISHIRDSDSDRLWEFVSNRNVTRYLTWDAYTSKTELDGYMDKSKKKTGFPDEVLGIYIDDAIVGTMHIIHRGANKIQFGFGIMEDSWGRGIATKACLLAIEHIKLNWLKESEEVVLWADIHEENAAAASVIEKLGFSLESRSIEPNRDRYSMIIQRGCKTERTHKNGITEKAINIFSSDERVFSTFTTGSTARKDWNEFSDIDLWVVVGDESDLNNMLNEAEGMLAGIDPVFGLYKCTEHHFFVVFSNLEMLDINFITCAQYFSITSRTKKFVKGPSFCVPGDKKLEITAPLKGQVEQLFLRGYTELFRVASKYKNDEMWVIPRFVGSLRNNSILPLMSLIHGYGIPNSVLVDMKKLKPEHKDLITSTFPKPEREDAMKSIRACNSLLDNLYADGKPKYNLSDSLSLFVAEAGKKMSDFYEEKN